MFDQDPSLFGTPPLPGEAASGKFEIRSDDGALVDPARAIFPIIRISPDGYIDLIGTGFFITTNGIFITARHVLEAPFDRRTGRQLFSIAMIHLPGNGTYFIRPILRCALHPVADVTVGVAAPMARNSDGAPLTNARLTLALSPVEPLSHVVTFAYPLYENVRFGDAQIVNVMPAYYDGTLIEHLPKGRDRVLLPGPCYRTSIAIHHGASGGPVFSSNGMVFAINSTGFDGTNDSYVSEVGGILDLSIDDVVVDNQTPRSVSIREMIQAGHIVVNRPFPIANKR